MFKVNFPLEIDDMLYLKNTDLDNLWLPKGYVGTKISYESFNIFSLHDAKVIGGAEMMSAGLIITVDEETEEGSKFWLKFGKMHPELNPAQIRFAVVSETDGLFRLEDEPEQMPGNALKEIERYSKIGSCYFVKFLTGHLEKELLIVMKMQPILADGSLGEDLGEAKLPLWGE